MATKISYNILHNQIYDGKDTSSHINTKILLILVNVVLLFFIMACSNNSTGGEELEPDPRIWTKLLPNYGVVLHAFQLNDGTNLILSGGHLINIDNSATILSDIALLDNTYAHDMKLLPDNEFLVCGNEYEPENRWESFVAVIAKYSHDGKLIWKIYPTEKELKTSCPTLNLISDNRYSVAAVTDRIFGEQYTITIKTLNKEGNVLDSFKFNSDTNRTRTLSSIFLTSDSKLLLTNYNEDQNLMTYRTLNLMEFDGTILWQQNFTSTVGDGFLKLYEESDAYLLAGNLFRSGWVVRIQKDGTLDWEEEFKNDDKRCGFWGVTKNIENNGYAFVGTTYEPDRREGFWLLVTDLSGNHKWEKRYENPHKPQWGYCITQTSDQHYLMGGWASGNASAQDGLLYKVNANGTLTN